MRFPSLAYLGQEARNAFTRFPLVLVSGMVAAAGGVAAVEFSQDEYFYLRFLFSGSLGLSLFTALTLTVEKKRLSRGKALLLHLVGVVLLVGFFLSWPTWREPVAVRRFFQLAVGFHLLAAVLPYLGLRGSVGDLNGFWQYNRSLFLRFLTSVIYTVVLFAGISMAILALDKLFGLDVPGETYADLWIICAFVFNTWIFVGGLPRDFARLQASQDYPRGLRVFSQFILVPLVTLYLVILTLYMGKIAITQVWPSGWIGYLVSSVAVVGILSLLLIFPVAGREENRWMRSYSRWFYVALLPSVAMLLMAIMKRIGQYGITENRYFMVVLAVWLGLVALYFILSRGKNIKVIPATLALLAFVTFYGPWGAYAVSSRSQTERLKTFLTEREVLVEGRIRKEADVSFEDRRELSAMLHYLIEAHGADPIESWFEDGLAWTDTLGMYGSFGYRSQTSLVAQGVMRDMGLEYVHGWQHVDTRTFHLWTGPGTGALRIADYDYVLHFENLPSAPVVLEEREYVLEYEEKTREVLLREDDLPLIGIPVGGLIERAYREGGRPARSDPPDSLTVTAENDRAAVLMLVRGLGGQEKQGEPVVTSLNADVFLNRKQP